MLQTFWNVFTFDGGAEIEVCCSLLGDSERGFSPDVLVSVSAVIVRVPVHVLGPS